MGIPLLEVEAFISEPSAPATSGRVVIAAKPRASIVVCRAPPGPMGRNAKHRPAVRWAASVIRDTRRRFASVAAAR
jgi:hypothetical protein